MNGGLVLLMVGDELLDGRSRDTNSDLMIERAGSLGWRVDAIEVGSANPRMAVRAHRAVALIVGDDKDDIWTAAS